LLIGPVTSDLQTNPCQIFFKMRQQPPIDGAAAIPMSLNFNTSPLQLQQQAVVTQSNHTYGGIGADPLHNPVGNVGRGAGSLSRQIPRPVETHKYQQPATA
jgi:hypothetical protein